MKLTFNPHDNSYTINRKKIFNGLTIQRTDLRKAFDFAYEMCFGEGHHRKNARKPQYPGRLCG